MENQQLTVGIYTLGCKVNQYESEAIGEQFAKLGFSLQSPSSACDVYVINTCTVTAESDRKAGQVIRRLHKQNPSAYILVTGCMAQTQPERVAKISGVDYVCGNADKLSVVKEALALCERGKKNETPIIQKYEADAHGFEKMSVERFDRTRAYVKIEDGCESHCAYCIIPAARGKIRSKAPADVLDEVRKLTVGGCREIVLTGIETASYGKDLEQITLADLLCKIDRIEGVGRIRLGSLDPSMMTETFVKKIARLSHLAPHFHLSMQSGSDKILASMKRKYNTALALAGIERLKEALPEVRFTTDVIVGFPGETEEDFEDTVAFAKKVQFLKMHVFPYSRRAGTVADKMPNQVPEEIKHQRVSRLIAVDEEIRFELLEKEIGKTETVLFETFENGIAAGHTKNFTEVLVKSPVPLHSELLNVKILSHDKDFCYGELSEEK